MMASNPPSIVTAPNGAGNTSKLLLTPREAAEALSVCEKTLFNLTRRGELPAVKIGRSVRYAVDDLRAFVNGRKGVGHESC